MRLSTALRGSKTLIADETRGKSNNRYQDMTIRVAIICRYPVKGLSPEYLERVTLTPGEGLPQDRRFAIAHESARFDPERPEWLPKTNFLMLMRDEALAQLRTRFDEHSGFLTIERDGEEPVRARITDATGRLLVGEFFARFLRGSVRGTPKVVEAPGHTFSDAKQRPGTTTYKYVSVANLASIGALERAVRIPIDPTRFRANLYLDGVPAWEELDWVGRDVTVGSARLRIISPTRRCAATAVNPTTAERDLDVLGALQRAFGHMNMGVYAEVIGGGEIVKGASVVPPGVTPSD